MRKSSFKDRLLSPGLLPVWLAVFAVIYYGLYYRCGYNLADEGNVALLSKRLLDGERPFKDMAMGYNLFWFYPIVGLFAVFGPSLIVTKVYFFTLAAITALLGYQCVAVATRKPWLAFAVGLVLVIIPGTPFRTYIPFLAVSNSLMLVLVAILSPTRPGYWVALLGGSLLLTLTFLIRVEIGMFFLMVWLGLAIFRVFDLEIKWLVKIPVFLATLLLPGLIAWSIHQPIYNHARSAGYGKEFVLQYTNYYKILAKTLHFPEKKYKKIMKLPPGRTTNVLTIGKHDMGNLERRPISDVWKNKHWSKRMLPLLTYLPFVTFGLLMAWMTGISVLKLRAGETHPARDLLVGGVLVAGALTTFPQFYFFRPDLGHLSEFMPGCILALACGGCFIAGKIRFPLKGTALVAGVILGFLLAHIVLYISYALPERYAGTIAARKGRNKLFQAENGVRVYVTSEEFDGLTAITKTIQSYSMPGDYVVCYPYAPGINFMTNRPTYEYWLYVDNATHSLNWESETIDRFRGKKPAAIVISDWNINRNDASLFSHWAPQVKKFIDENYHNQGTYLRHTVYTREAGPL